MSTLDHLIDLPEQICYVQCGFCTTILLVSVPSSSLSMVVTVRCGHCTSLLSVNMMKVSFEPFHLLASLTPDDHGKREGNLEGGSTKRALDCTHSPSELISSDNEEDDHIVNRVINKPPEKRQRTPSAYNRFIKEEIRRLKAENPSMAHKEAFSTAAKNWANFPPIQYQEDGDAFGQEYNAPTWHYEALDYQVNIEGEVSAVQGIPKGQKHLFRALSSLTSEIRKRLLLTVLCHMCPLS